MIKKNILEKFLNGLLQIKPSYFKMIYELTISGSEDVAAKNWEEAFRSVERDHRRFREPSSSRKSDRPPKFAHRRKPKEHSLRHGAVRC